MGTRGERLRKIRSRISDSAAHPAPALIGRRLREAGALDRAVLNQQIEAIFEDAAGNLQAIKEVEQQLEAAVLAARQGEVRQAAGHVAAVLGADLDDLRKAALLSLMVRLAGKREFDPVAAYVLQKRAICVTGQG